MAQILRVTAADLDGLRQVGDLPADQLIDRIFEAHAIEGVRLVLRRCNENDHPLDGLETSGLPEGIQRELSRWFQETSAQFSVDEDEVRRAQDLFSRAGPEVLLVLACYALPAAYAAAKGVQVLAQTNRLGSEPNRRLFETAQMVIDVLSPGGLGPGGRGLRTAQKVRLMHAAIRRLISHAGAAASEVPINQEDLGGTLMTFSHIILDGLERMGIPVPPAERQAYLALWSGLGGVLGVDERLCPRSLEEARALTEVIRDRQIAGSEAGRKMAAALIGMMRGHLPCFLSGLPPALIRFFLGKHADPIGVPKAGLWVLVARALHAAFRWIDRLFEANPWSARLHRRLNLALMQAMVDFERHGERAPFDIPDHLLAKHPRGGSRARAVST